MPTLMWRARRKEQTKRALVKAVPKGVLEDMARACGDDVAHRKIRAQLEETVTVRWTEEAHRIALNWLSYGLPDKTT